MYKTKLQELCHHNAWTLPDYAIIRDGPDHCPRYQATVSVNGRSFNSPSLSPSSKKAQNDAAKVAFDFLSAPSSTTPAPATPSLPVAISAINSSNIYLNDKFTPGGSLQAQNIIARVNGKFVSGETCTTQSQDANGTPQVNETPIVPNINHKFADAENLCKNRLQSYAQKKGIGLPVYSCELIGPPHVRYFKCKVTVDGQTYESQEMFSTLSKAEQAAAKVALMSLPLEGIQEDESAYKNLLQELAQKKSFRMPAYSTSNYGESHIQTFISTVEVDGQIFSGLTATTKKKAEFSAAKVAYTALKQCNSKESPLPSNSGISSAYPVGSTSSNLRQSIGFDNSNQIAPSLLPPCQRRKIAHGTSSSRPDLTAYLHKNAPIQPELSGCDEEPLEEKEVVGDVPPIASPASSVPDMTCFPKVDLLSSSSPADPPTDSVVILSAGENGKVASMSQNKVIVHPRSMNVSYPPGSTVLSMSDDTWVAVRISTEPGDKA